MNVGVSKSAIGMVASRQRQCADITSGALEKCLDMIKSARIQVKRGEDPITVLQALETNLKSQKLSKFVANATCDYHDAIKALGKVRSHIAFTELHGLEYVQSKQALLPSLLRQYGLHAFAILRKM
jgi:uroporphyrinogen-III decarboxylase